MAKYITLDNLSTFLGLLKSKYELTDSKVKQTVTASNANYPLLLAPSGQTATTTGQSYFDSGVTLNPSTNTLTATYFDGKLKPRLVFGSGTNAKDKYILIGEFTATSAWYGFHGLFHFIGIENTNIGTLYLTMRTGGKVETLDSAKAIWTTLNDTTLINSIYITHEDNIVDGAITSKTIRIYILWPYTYKRTAIVCPYYNDISFNFVGDIVDNYTGTLAGQSEHSVNYFKNIQCPNGGVGPNAYADTLTINHDEIVKVNGSDANNSITLSHATSGVSASSYGPSANATPAHGGTFSVPYFTVNAQGHVTAASTKTITLPADNNTDTKNTAGSTNSSSKLYLIGATEQSANPQTYSNSNVYATNGDLVANSFHGSIKGTSTSDVNTAYKELHFKFYNNVSGCDSTVSTDGKRYAGTANSFGFPVSNNANAMLWIGAHSGNYGHQLGFSSDGRIYDRYVSNGSFSTAVNGGSWKKVAWASEIPTKFTGTAAEHNHTFTGTKVGHTHTFSGSASHDHTFSGTAATHTHTVSSTGTAANSGLTISYSNGELTITTSHTHTVSSTGTAAASGALTVTGTVGSNTVTISGTTDNTDITPAGTIGNKSLTPAGTLSVG